MKRTIILALCIMAVLPLGAQQKKRFTDEQLLSGSGQEIIKMNALPLEYQGGNLVYLRGRDRYIYDVKECVSRKLPAMKPAGPAGMPPAGFSPAMPVGGMEEMVKGWVNPTYSPDSTRIAYTLDNDLYSIDVRTREVVRHTYDGNELILNGYASWVYYEEIFGRPSRYRAFWWSPDSKVIAFYRFDNTKVPMFPIYNSRGQHGSLNQTRYPKAGDPNPEVKIGFVSAKGGETLWADFDPKLDQYFGTPFWSGDGKRLMVSWMSRSQDDFELFSVNPLDGQKVSVYKEHQDSWIDWMEKILFTEKGIYIVRDISGWQQAYYLTYDGSVFDCLTTGHNWSMDLLKVDRKYLYYTAKCEATTRFDIYRVNLKTKEKDRISYGDYSFSNVVISDDGLNVAALACNGVTPYRLVNITLPKSGKMDKRKVEVVYNTKGPEFDKYEIALPEIVQVKTRDGLTLPASVIWPIGMDKNRKYPVKVNIYGGPDNPQVYDRWNAMQKQWWANHGVIQVTLDNRAGGHQGKRGIEQVYRNLGVLEIRDFIDGIKYFLAMPYVDPDKIGVEGFSFGGTMTTLCVTEGSDYFKYGIAGGGVYDWALYDTHYTERYMDTPQDNPDGYAAGRVIDRISNYKGDKTNMLRLTHGTGDDNVHFQNTLQLVDELERQHKDFELMIYPQGMHGYRGDQSMHAQLQDYKFWYRYLLDSDLPEVISEHFAVHEKR